MALDRNGEFPVHEEIDVLDGYTIYKNSSWWKAIVLVDGFRGQEVGVYLWKNSGDTWSRKQKYIVRSQEDWDQDRAIINKYVEKLSSD